MNQKAIIAGWMSPLKIRRFAECNIAINFLMFAMKYLFSQMKISGMTRNIYDNLFHWYGVAVFCMAIFILMLSRITGMNGIDRKRVWSLIILGIMNLGYALVMIWR